MRTSWVCLLGGVALAFTFNAALAAQQDKKPKKAKQTQDHGIDDADVSVVTDKNAEGAVVVRRPDGSLLSILDESFLEATVAVKNADGTITYRCFRGLPAAANHLTQAAKPAAPALEVK
jgi:hypothetical protein